MNTTIAHRNAIDTAIADRDLHARLALTFADVIIANVLDQGWTPSDAILDQYRSEVGEMQAADERIAVLIGAVD